MKTKKELQAEYKEIKPRMGVFQIRNAANGKIFVDVSKDLDAIWNRHSFSLRMGGHKNAALQADWYQYGAEAFHFEVLSEIEVKETETADYDRELKALSVLYLEELTPYDERGYNKRPKI